MKSSPDLFAWSVVVGGIVAIVALGVVTYVVAKLCARTPLAIAMIIGSIAVLVGNVGNLAVTADDGAQPPHCLASAIMHADESGLSP